MKITLSLLTAILSCWSAATACTCFLLHSKDQLLFGRNYDWVTGSGMIYSNQRGLAKTSHPMSDGKTISWVSRYGSTTFNQYGKEFPTGGMNEKGLVVELMMLEATRYPEADDRPAVGALQWIQYQLDNCGSVEELIATDKKIRIAAKGTTPIHFLVADAGGHAATIEYLDGKMAVHTGEALSCPVLTNDRYDQSLARLNATTESSTPGRPAYIQNSMGRFLKAASLLKQFKEKPGGPSALDYSFHILNEVAQGNHTKWSIVYDISNRKIHFKTLAQPVVKYFDMNSFDFSCAATPKGLDINCPGQGNQSAFFINYSTEKNRELINRSFAESPENLKMDTERMKRFMKYPETIGCELKINN